MSFKEGDAYRLKAYFADGTFKYDSFEDAVTLELVPQIVGLQKIVVDLEGKKPIYYIRRSGDFNNSSESLVETSQEYFIGYESIPKKLLSIRVYAEIREIEDDDIK